MLKIEDLDTKCIFDLTKDCTDCDECIDKPTYCCMDSNKICDGCWDC